MYAFSKRRRPTTCSSIQGRHASAVACAHQLGDIARGLPASLKRHRSWYARLKKEILANGRQHKPWHARMSRGVCVSDGRHYSRPTAGGISHGLHASDVACAYLANDIGQRQAASAKDYTFQPWRVCNGWATLASANDMHHQPRPARISRGVCASTERHRLWRVRIRQATSFVACAH